MFLSNYIFFKNEFRFKPFIGDKLKNVGKLKTNTFSWLDNLDVKICVILFT